MDKYDVREDLKFRPLVQQVEILWISGPTWHNAERIAEILGITERRVREIVEEL